MNTTGTVPDTDGHDDEATVLPKVPFSPIREELSKEVGYCLFVVLLR
jgi:hypothetical protein